MAAKAIGIPARACFPAGMPATMNGYNSMEIVVLPEGHLCDGRAHLPIHRRIFTDGRDWPQEAELTFQATRSAAGSIPPAAAVSTRWRSRPGSSRGRA